MSLIFVGVSIYARPFRDQKYNYVNIICEVLITIIYIMFASLTNATSNDRRASLVEGISWVVLLIVIVQCLVGIIVLLQTVHNYLKKHKTIEDKEIDQLNQEIAEEY